MKKLMILIMTMLMIKVFCNSAEIEKKTEINNILATFQLQKIIYNDIEGFFIPFSGYKQMLFFINDYLFLQEKTVYLQNENEMIMKKLLKYDVIKTSFQITLSIAIIEMILIVATAFFCYSIAKYNL